MTVVESATRATNASARIAIAEDADRRQDRIIGDVQRAGFVIDWSAILDDNGDEPLHAIESKLIAEFRRSDFGETIAVLGINGKLLASFVQIETERLAGMKTQAQLVSFAEAAALGRPESAVEYWTRILNLTKRQAEEVRSWTTAFRAREIEIRGRVTDDLMSKITRLFSEAIQGNKGVPEFVKQARAILPDQSRAVLESEYRTHLSTVYNDDRHEQIVSRANAFPFTQFFNPADARTTVDICLPMATAGPNKRGYIAATEDQTWFTWKGPNHYACRSTISPIGYRECIRMGILAGDGKTKIAIIGSNPNRPYGDPPEFAENASGKLVRVQPAEGFR